MPKETIIGTVVSKANNYVASGNGKHKKIVKSARLRKYEMSFAFQCRQYRNKKINKPFKLEVDIYYRDNNHDIDNSIKTILDCLQYAGAITNDNLLYELVAKKHISQQARIEYSIEEIKEQQK